MITHEFSVYAVAEFVKMVLGGRNGPGVEGRDQKVLGYFSSGEALAKISATISVYWFNANMFRVHCWDPGGSAVARVDNNWSSPSY
jgi:hypothetical protein